ncbi:MAG: alpha/beta hydrolase [Gemmatimonadetes bacterium]|jgi:acetyl esterase/lipase|nr:alpha/beta hydrolase [Gemmatimonadota bacterium]
MKQLTGRLKNGLTNPAPPIDCYLPEPDQRNGIGLIIFPGGGYGHLAEHEGKGYAEHFAAAGITCFVVSYRLGTDGHRHPAMLEDGLAAIAEIRSRADEFGIAPSRIGIMGSSAGGHLTAHLLVAYDQRESSISLRPDFGILCYPVITTTSPHAHAGSRANLLGEDPSPELIEEVSCELHVTPQTPPCFLWHTGEDLGVPAENSMLFAASLRKQSVPFELHIYHKGGHGLGLGADFPWAIDCLRWIKETV